MIDAQSRSFCRIDVGSRHVQAIDTAEPELAAPATAAAGELAKAAGADVRIVHVRYMVEAAVDYLPKSFFADEEKRTLTQTRGPGPTHGPAGSAAVYGYPDRHRL